MLSDDVRKIDPAYVLKDMSKFQEENMIVLVNGIRIDPDLWNRAQSEIESALTIGKATTGQDHEVTNVLENKCLGCISVSVRVKVGNKTKTSYTCDVNKVSYIINLI